MIDTSAKSKPSPNSTWGPGSRPPDTPAWWSCGDPAPVSPWASPPPCWGGTPPPPSSARGRTSRLCWSPCRRTSRHSPCGRARDSAPDPRGSSASGRLRKIFQISWKIFHRSSPLPSLVQATLLAGLELTLQVSWTEPTPSSSWSAESRREMVTIGLKMENVIFNINFNINLKSRWEMVRIGLQVKSNMFNIDFS